MRGCCSCSRTSSSQTHASTGRCSWLRCWGRWWRGVVEVPKVDALPPVDEHEVRWSRAMDEHEPLTNPALGCRQHSRRFVERRAHGGLPRAGSALHVHAVDLHAPATGQLLRRQWARGPRRVLLTSYKASLSVCPAVADRRHWCRVVLSRSPIPDRCTTDVGRPCETRRTFSARCWPRSRGALSPHRRGGSPLAGG
jgi:hypothetical protein